jgi:succinate-semialdehyde dehydrogenase/glutarate-semialdehyde dehydrogenase
MTHLTTINPATEQVLKTYPLMDQNTVNNVINTMEIARVNWLTKKMADRKKCLLALGELLKNTLDEMATLISQEMGKPISQAKAEINKCTLICDYYANNFENFLSPEKITTEYHKSYRSFEPLGIIFAIMPWNFPFWQVFRFAVPNIMLGNAGLLKHAPNTTGTALAIENLFLKAGFPENLFRSLIIDIDLVPFVIHHPAVAGVTLTGSNRAGQSVAKIAADAMKKVVLELGGSDPYLILADADLELAAEECVKSRLNNAGQVCISAKRLIVHESVKAEFEKLVLEKAKKYVGGDPLNPETNLGPMARQDLRQILHAQVERCLQEGSRCLLGGKLPSGVGYYYPVTVLTDVKSDSTAFREELFGPVICITSVKNEAEAIHLANQTIYGLGAAVFTRDLEKGEHIAAQLLQAGTCVVNTLVASDPRLPFGGIKQSGYGRELSLEGMREFANIKTVVVKR